MVMTDCFNTLRTIEHTKRSILNNKVDHHELEHKKNHLKKELLRLQQNIKFVVASADDRYTNLSFDTQKRFVINPGNPVLCRLKLKGCETPVTFHC